MQSSPDAAPTPGRPRRPRDPGEHGFRVGGVVVAAVVVGILLWIAIIMGGLALYHALAH
jgi:hypothetical protein